MLTDDEIYGHATGMLNAAGGIYADSVIDFARAIESAVRAEYADVPPEKFKGLYRAIQPVVDYAGAYGSIEARGDRMQAVMDALYSIDNGTYSPKIGGE